MTTKTKAILLFLIGLFSETEIRLFGSIGISELIIFICAPIVFLQDQLVLRRQGFGTILFLLIATLINCFIACLLNDTSFIRGIKGIAQIYALFASIVIFRRLLYQNLSGISYFLVGASLSIVLCIFVFQKGVFGGGYESSEEVMQKTIGHALFWFSMFKTFSMLPIQAWYLKIPSLYSYAAPFCLGAFVILTTESGRAASLSAFATAILIFVGKKSRMKMASISRNFVFFVISALILLFCFKTAYTTLAQQGTLGEKAQKKLEMQTGGKTDALSILMGGRVEFFVGIMSALKKPFVGYGPWAVDKDGLYEEFIYKYGNSEDVERYKLWQVYQKQNGLTGKFGLIKSHSHIGAWWVYFGIMGPIFWVYVLYLIVGYFRKWVAVYPPLFGYFCVYAPSFVWAIFFSPFGGRVAKACFLTCLLIVKAMSEKRMSNPWDLRIHKYK